MLTDGQEIRGQLSTFSDLDVRLIWITRRNDRIEFDAVITDLEDG